MAEAMVPPRSPLVGADVFPGMVTNSGDLIVVAVQRRGKELEGDTALVAGDTMLLQGTWGALHENIDASEVLVVDPPELVRRQTMGPGGYRFGDYWKLGLTVLALFFVVATLLAPVLWSF